MTRRALDDLKQRISLLDYLQAQDWRPLRRLAGDRWMGLCPLHPDRKPSFLVDGGKRLFYCYGCGRGGDIFRFVELYHQVNFAQALAALLHWHGRDHQSGDEERPNDPESRRDGNGWRTR